MNPIDILRSILIGQSVWVALWLGFIYFMRLRENPRPGLIIGITAFSLGDLAAISYILVTTINRLGQPANAQTWLATLAIVGESFGCVLIATHMVLHNPAILAKIKSWFHHE